MKIVFRADANHIIGMGHVMRCLSIADAAKFAGQEVCFILADENAKKIVDNRGFRTVVLHSDYQNLNEEKWPDDLCPDLVVVDSYYVTPTYFKRLRKSLGAKLAFIDDVYSFPYPVDFLINYNAYGNNVDYRRLYGASQVPTLMLGPSYAPLRSMFKDIEEKQQNTLAKNILVSTGGADELHLALSILRLVLDQAGGYIYHFLIGAMNKDREELHRIGDGNDYIKFDENVTDMKSLICSMDLIISAAGSTLYEVCACGVPLITYSIADNQIAGAEAFEEMGLGVNVGDLRVYRKSDHIIKYMNSLSCDAGKKILSEVDNLARDYKRRVKMGKQMQQLIDGYGAERIINGLLSICT